MALVVLFALAGAFVASLTMVPYVANVVLSQLSYCPTARMIL